MTYFMISFLNVVHKSIFTEERKQYR